jgi:hypothetical protein
MKDERVNQRMNAWIRGRGEAIAPEPGTPQATDAPTPNAAMNAAIRSKAGKEPQNEKH